MIVGVAGHQNLGKAEKVNWVYKEISKALKKYHVTQGLTCLASGADQIYAEILKKENIPYIAVIPCENYETTFKVESSYESYISLLSNAVSKIKLGFTQPSEIAFLEAGKKLVDLSTAIFAIWNGKKAQGLGGTADIVQYALDKHIKVVHFNPINRTIMEI